SHTMSHTTRPPAPSTMSAGDREMAATRTTAMTIGHSKRPDRVISAGRARRVLGRHRRAGEHIGDDSRAGASTHLRVGDEEEPVAEHGGRLRLHVVGQYVRATANR